MPLASLIREHQTAWSLVIDHSFGPATLAREEVASPTRTRRPFQDWPFGDVVAWANVEWVTCRASIA